MAEAAFRLPDQLNVTEGNISENFRKWKRQVNIYLTASGAITKEKPTQVAIILHCAGPNVVELFYQFTWDNADDSKDPDKVFQKLENYCNPRANEVIESHRFWATPWQEPIDIFLTELRNRDDRRNFGTLKSRLIRDKIIFTSQGKLQLQLLKDDNDTLESTIKLCRIYEQSVNHAKELSEGGNASMKVNKVTKPSTRPSQSKQKHNFEAYGKSRRPGGKSNHVLERKLDECDYCGGTHERNKYKCPAYGKTCDHCKGRNHFKKKCKKIHMVELKNNDSEDDNFQWLSAVKSTRENNVSAGMVVNGQQVRFQLDSAADVNTINQKFVRKNQVRPTKIRLKMWNKSDLKPFGETDLDVINEKTGEKHKVTFTVVPNGLMCLLGLKTIQDMGFVTINNNKFVSAVSKHQLGDLGEATLKVDPEIPAKTLPCRKIPIAIQDAVKHELDSLVDRGVLIPVTEPTKWVSQMAVVHKANGKLRICLDPQPLNTALIRERYKLPTLDDVRPDIVMPDILAKLT